MVGLLQSINKNKTILVSYTVEMDLFACYMKHKIMIAIMELCNTVYDILSCRHVNNLIVWILLFIDICVFELYSLFWLIPLNVNKKTIVILQCGNVFPIYFVYSQRNIGSCEWCEVEGLISIGLSKNKSWMWSTVFALSWGSHLKMNINI